MDDLLKSLNSLGVEAPSDSQIPDLLNPENYPTLAKILAGSADDLIEGAILSLLENYLRSLRRAEDDYKRSISAPKKNVKIIPRSALLIRAVKERERIERDKVAGVGRIRQSQVFDQTIPCSNKPINELSYIQLKDLQFPNRHTGKFVIVRVISNPNTLFDLHCIVDDKFGSAIPLTLTHFTPSPTVPSDSILPYGSFLLIREPYVTKNGIYVPAKSDVRILNENDDIIKDDKWEIDLEQPLNDKQSVQLLSESNRQDDNIWKIIHNLKQALKIQPNSFECKIKLSDAYFGVSKTGSAYREANDALKLSNNSIERSKCYLNLAKTAYDLRLFSQSDKCLNQIDDEQLQGEVNRLKFLISERLDEKFNGKFNVAELFNKKQNSIAPRLDIADYIGPIEVKNIEGRGRGVLATEDVAPGTLMLVGKAVGTCYPSDADENKDLHTTMMELNYSSKTLHGTAQVLARTKIALAIEDAPFLAKRVLALCGAPDEPLIEEYVKDEFPLTVDEDEAVKILESDELPVIDVDPRRIGSVLKYNAFGHASIAGAETPCMLHSLPAIINHSCVPNVASIHLGDIILSRALIPLKKGQELLHSYVPGTGSGSAMPPSQQERRNELSKHGFKCLCELCALDELDGQSKLKERGLMLADVWPRLLDRARVLNRAKNEDEKFNNELDQLLEELNEFVTELENKFSDKRPIELKPELSLVRRTLAQLTARRDVPKAIDVSFFYCFHFGLLISTH